MNTEINQDGFGKQVIEKLKVPKKMLMLQMVNEHIIWSKKSSAAEEYVADFLGNILSIMLMGKLIF